MTWELFLSVLEKGGPTVLALVACFVVKVLWKDNKELQGENKDLQAARLTDLKEDRATLRGMTEDIVAEMTKTRIALVTMDASSEGHPRPTGKTEAS